MAKKIKDAFPPLKGDVPKEDSKELCCGTCPYWRALTEPGIGNCIRFPPNGHKKDLTTLGPLGNFIITHRVSLCGEHPHFFSGPTS